MKRTIPILLVGALIGGLVAFNRFTASAKPPEQVKLEKGAKIHAILLKELTSGGTREGEEVPLMVSEDLKDPKGRVLIAKGTPVLGEVTWSRTEGTLGRIANQPARLKIKLKSTSGIDGTAINLSASAKEEADYEFNRDNTGKGDASEKLEALVGDQSDGKALEAIRDLFENGNAGDLAKAENRDSLAKIAAALGMPTTAKLTEDNEVAKVADLVQQIRRGVTIANVATGGSATLVDAALELANVAGQVGNRLGRMLGGRNIHAYVGTPVEAYVHETVTIKIPDAS